MSDGTHRECPGAGLGIPIEELICRKFANEPRYNPARLQRTFVKTFEPQFAEAIRDRTKLQTIRQWPKRARDIPHCLDRLDCRQWSGIPYRSKQLHLGIRLIKVVQACTIYHERVTLYSKYHEVTIHNPGKLDDFAKYDGFPDWSAMRAYFNQKHHLPFYGMFIQW